MNFCMRRMFCARPAAPTLAAVALFAALAGTAAAGETGAAEVTIDNFAFTPAEITVKAGAVVVFHNRDDIPHSIVAADFHSKALDTDDEFSYVFAKPGEYDYFCGLHPHMTGKVIVTP